MTARPIFPERGRRLTCAAVALVLVMVAVLLAAGCEKPIDRHIAIIKISEYGFQEWNKVIDSGMGDYPSGGVLTSDGGYIMGYTDCEFMCGGATRLIKFSGDGKQLWDRDIKSTYGCLGNSINTTRKGDIITNSRHTICRFDPDGQLIWNQSTLPLYITSPVIETDDGGFILIGLIFNEFILVQVPDNDGNRTWVQFPSNQSLYDPNYNREIWSYNVTIIKLDRSGTISSQHTFIDYEFTNISQVLISEDQQGYFFYANRSKDGSTPNQTFVVSMDRSGKFIDVTPYNQTAGSSGDQPWVSSPKCSTGISTRDGGCLSVYLKEYNTNVYVEESNRDYNRTWKNVLSAVPVIDKVVWYGQSTDGGYFIIGGHVKNAGRSVGNLLSNPIRV
jgi:hypothetical protein